MDRDDFAAWSPRLLQLCDRIRRAVLGARSARLAPSVAVPPVRRGAGDLSFPLDVCAEEALSRWFDEQARETPLSVLTEDCGWMHSSSIPFDHGGPRIAVDPIDGTRNFMADLRPAWTVISFAPAGAGEPRLSDVNGGILAELPLPQSRAFRIVSARRGEGARLAVHDIGSEKMLAEETLLVDHGDQVDHGYFCFFRYSPDMRPALAEIEAAFFERLARLEGADVRSCYDDQYISSAGQLFLLASGTYRMVADLRGFMGSRMRRSTVASKPYDLAGALLCAAEAGCTLTDPAGFPLSFPIDASTPVSFVGYANASTHARLSGHLQAVLKEQSS